MTKDEYGRPDKIISVLAANPGENLHKTARRAEAAGVDYFSHNWLLWKKQPEDGVWMAKFNGRQCPIERIGDEPGEQP